MLREALELHAETLEALEGESFTYTRASTSASVVAIMGQTRLDEETGFRASVAARLLDCMIRPKWLIDNDLGEPQGGDLLVNSEGRRFEVRNQGQQPAWRWSDPRHLFYRLHLNELKPNE